MTRTLVLSVFLSVVPITGIRADEALKAFPEAEQGMVRHVLQLPAQEDESGFRVELAVGKTVSLDPHNRYFFSGSIEEQTVEGWGFTKYRVQDLGIMAGTLMAVDPNAPKVDRFITLGGEPRLIRYNSKLPVVIYVPEGVEVRYRFWRADETFRMLDKG